MSEKPEVRSRSGKPLPVVVCPGCQIAMIPLRKSPVPLTEQVEIVYRCDKCGTETKRQIRDD